MGADIHLYVEKLNPETGEWSAVKSTNPRIKWNLDFAKNAREQGRIEQAEKWEKEAADIASGKMAKGAEDESDMEYLAPEVYADWAYDGRNYNLFGMLAGVRRHDDIPRFPGPKGLPHDISSYVESRSDYWDADGHSHSYLTLAELLDFDWEQGVPDSGWVSEEVYKQFKETGNPYPCSGGVGGGGVRHLNTVEMERLIAGKMRREPDATYYTQIKWEKPAHEMSGGFYSDTIPKLENISDSDNGEDIRIVFWFDN